MVAVARREDALGSLTEEARRKRGDLLPVALDITEDDAPRRVRDEAIRRFGGVHVWVNNAAVTALGRFEDIPPEDFRRVIETDLFGYVDCTRAVLPHFRAMQGGILINVASMVSRTTQPYATPYVTAKHAVRGFGMALRQELFLEGQKNIHVCNVMPAVIDTPFFQHAANYEGRKPKAMPPVYDVEKAAKAIVAVAKRPRRERFVGNAARMASLESFVAPRHSEKTLARAVDKTHFFDEAAPADQGNLYEPVSEGRETTGGWHGRRKTNLRRVALIGTVAALALASRDR